MKINKQNNPKFYEGKARWDAFVAAYTGLYDFSASTYAGMNRKVQFRCPTHGEMFSDAKLLILGSRCLKCVVAERKGRYKISPDEALRKFREVHGGAYTYPDFNYRGSNETITAVCPDHGAFYPTAHDHWKGTTCPGCFRDHRAGGSQRDTAETFAEKVRDVFENAFDLSHVQYVRTQQEIIVRCVEHNELCITRPNWIVKGQNPCPKCNHTKSLKERELFDFVKSMVPAFQRNRSVLPPKEIDVWVPSHNLGVEYHGVYWHTYDKVGDTHRKKWETAQKLGIRLVQIFEDEWRDKRPQIENRIRALLGKCETYDARKTTLVQLPPKDAMRFLNDHHTQGAGRAKLYYGLRFNNELVAVASFGPSRSGAMTDAEGDGWEVIRYASKGRVRGGFSKLFAQFKKDVQPSQVVSYCDLRFGDGKLYEACGFSLDKITEPDYWWVPVGGLVRIPRYQTQKHKLENHPVLRNYYAKGLTEKQICESAGWQKIYGVGHQRWVYAA